MEWMNHLYVSVTIPADEQLSLIVLGMEMIFFFFSSRRRHTRLQGDWSSDVCSSDLQGAAGFDLTAIAGATVDNIILVNCELRENLIGLLVATQQGAFASDLRVVNCSFVGNLNTDRKSVV